MSDKLFSLPSGKTLKLEPQLLSACIHCGLCLPACPTYLSSGLEAESPRGRIYLLTQLARENLASNARLQKHIDSCLGCMGCQTACPSGVQYERILEQARQHFTLQKSPWIRFIQQAIFLFLLPNQKFLLILTKLLNLYQKLRLQDMLEHLPVSPELAARLRWWNSLLPDPEPAPDLVSRPGSNLSNASSTSGVSGIPVQLFHGCVMNVLFKQANQATVRILSRHGYAVNTPPQTCCGALAAHAGERDIAAQLAEKNMELFAGTTGNIIVTASGCAAMMKEYEYLFDDPSRQAKSRIFSARIKDTVEVLHNIAAPKNQDNKTEQKENEQQGNSQAKLLSREIKVSYHAACHLCHVQQIRQQPIDILKAACGSCFIPLEEAENCCGSAGIYNLLQPEISKAVRERKIDCIEDSNCQMLVTTNPGCQLQIASGLKARQSPIKVLHIAEFIDQVENQGRD